MGNLLGIEAIMSQPELASLQAQALRSQKAAKAHSAADRTFGLLKQQAPDFSKGTPTTIFGGKEVVGGSIRTPYYITPGGLEVAMAEVVKFDGRAGISLDDWEDRARDGEGRTDRYAIVYPSQTLTSDREQVSVLNGNPRELQFPNGRHSIHLMGRYNEQLEDQMVGLFEFVQTSLAAAIDQR